MSIGKASRVRYWHKLGQRAVRSRRSSHVPARAVAELHDRLVTGDVGGLEPAKRELVVHDRDVEGIQARRAQGADRQAWRWPRIVELIKDRRSAGSANYRCSHLSPSVGEAGHRQPGRRPGECESPDSGDPHGRNT